MLTPLLLLAAAPALDLATYAYPAFDRRTALAPLGAALAERLGRPVEITLYPDPTALAQAVRAGKVDVAATNLASFIEMQASPAVQPVAVIDTPAATRDRYRGVLLARRDSGVASVSDIAPRASARLRYTEVLPGSASGGLVQARMLRRRGTEPASFARLSYAGTHEGALAELAEGRTDVAALAAAAWDALRARQPDEAKQLVELWRSPAIPAGPLVCIESNDVDCTAIKAVVLESTPRLNAAAAAVARGWSETAGGSRFLPYEAEAYEAFEAVPAPLPDPAGAPSPNAANATRR